MGGRVLKQPVGEHPRPPVCSEDTDAAFLLPQILKIKSTLN